VQIEIHSDPGGFETLAGEWNELLHDSAVDTIFLTLQWQSIWWHHLGDGFLTLVVLRDKSGRLVGLAPLRRTPTEDGGWELTTVGCVDVSDYVDIIARRGHEANGSGRRGLGFAQVVQHSPEFSHSPVARANDGRARLAGRAAGSRGVPHRHAGRQLGRVPGWVIGQGTERVAAQIAPGYAPRRGELDHRGIGA